MLTFIFIIRFFDLLVCGLMAGMVVVVWLRPNTSTISDVTYIENIKAFINAVNKKMPTLLLLSLLMTLNLAIFQIAVLSVFIPLMLAVVFLVLIGMITRSGNRPIEKQILRWPVNYLPDKWEYLIDRWWYFHNLRVLFVLLVFMFVIFSSLYTS
jgi:Ca2+/Na+ antiporter